MEDKEKMKFEIRKMIESFPSGYTFYSHEIIDELFKKHHVYKNCKGNLNTNIFHAQIAHIISAFEGDLVTCEGKGDSKNIHGENSRNAQWKRI
jgi:hypothetical protein